MSGGGLNYLHNQDLEQLATSGDLEDAIAYLDAHPQGKRAANWCRYIADGLLRVKDAQEKLQPVWTVIDRRISCDVDDEEVDRVLQKFNQDNSVLRSVIDALNNLRYISQNQLEIVADDPLDGLIAANYKILAKLQAKIFISDRGEEVFKVSQELAQLTQAFASLAEAQEKLCAIATTTNVKTW